MDKEQGLKVMSILEERTKELAEPVKRFTRDCCPMYDINANSLNDNKVLYLYKGAIEAVRDWIHLVLMADCFYNRREWAVLKLNLPEEEAVFEVEWKVSGVMPAEAMIENELTFKTPIGEINFFAYKCITGIKGNPVELLYKFFNSQIQRTHYQIQMKLGKDADGILNEEIMKRTGMHDILGIANLDSCLTHINEWFDKENREADAAWK